MARKKKEVEETRFMGAEDSDNPMLEATESNKEFAQRVREEEEAALNEAVDEALENAGNDIAGPDDKISSEIIKWDVKLELDDERAHELGLDMAQRMKRIGEIERHLAAVRKEGKDEIEGHEDLIRKSAKILNDGIESKQMDCQMVRNFTRGVCYVVRLDTRAVVETIAMEGDAAQMEIPEVTEEEVKVEAKEEVVDVEDGDLCGRCKKNKGKHPDDKFGIVCQECDDVMFDEDTESAGG